MSNRWRTASWLFLLLLPMTTIGLAQVEFDFETPYLVHPGRQVWDFCLIEDQGFYHAFYHSFPQQTLNPAAADTIWHAVSADLRHWNIQGPVLTAGPDWWDAEAMWAPDVVYDTQSSRWAMLYTGVGAKMVQRACLAWSDDLESWTKSAANPVFEPDSLVYSWSPSQAWSSFRDPFLYHDGAQWNMLSTAALRLGGYPGYRRAIIHRAVSTDLVNWQDAGALYTHDGPVPTYDLESPQYVVRAGWHHLFFTEQDPNITHVPVSHMVAADPSGWTMAQRDIVDAGWAPEVEHFGSPGGPDVFARLAKDQDPRDDSWFITVKFDSVRFDDGGMTPVVSVADYLADWPTRTGVATVTVPTFADNPVLRGDFAQQPEGHGWFSSRENYGGPLTRIGSPGTTQAVDAVGSLLSRPFVLNRSYLGVMTICGRTGAATHISLEDADTAIELDRLVPYASHPLQERMWNVEPFLGRSVRLRIVDEDTTASGWIAVDRIREMDGPSAVGPVVAPLRARAAPNPFNGGTVIRLDLPVDTEAQVEIFDLQGRRVWRSPPLRSSAGRLATTWNAVDAQGRRLPSAIYPFRVMADGRLVAAGRLVLVK
ncbi:hypothetical protein COW53_02915 [bacterium CG17_big_fil_post_rev_8_21_14_2_50_64_8]|nr:MAG: hypothetical protein COW53_02915 [bacterium CG17_big_fil_post_rev_8_21_14_2_50_64_8]PJA73420.1 MAG: hypothetical protein CO151_13745 [bacterium CG_4_9_14_3_um_filter_65_15]